MIELSRPKAICKTSWPSWPATACLGPARIFNDTFRYRWETHSRFPQAALCAESTRGLSILARQTGGARNRFRRGLPRVLGILAEAIARGTKISHIVKKCSRRASYQYISLRDGLSGFHGAPGLLNERATERWRGKQGERGLFRHAKVPWLRFCPPTAKLLSKVRPLRPAEKSDESAGPHFSPSCVAPALTAEAAGRPAEMAVDLKPRLAASALTDDARRRCRAPRLTIHDGLALDISALPGTESAMRAARRSPLSNKRPGHRLVSPGGSRRPARGPRRSAFSFSSTGVLSVAVADVWLKRNLILGKHAGAFFAISFRPRRRAIRLIPVRTCWWSRPDNSRPQPGSRHRKRHPRCPADFFIFGGIYRGVNFDRSRRSCAPRDLLDYGRPPDCMQGVVCRKPAKSANCAGIGHLDQ